MEDRKYLEDMIARSKNAAEKAEYLGKLDKLIKEEAKTSEKKLDKNVVPTRDATPIADHKASRSRGRGDVMVSDRQIYMG